MQVFRVHKKELETYNYSQLLIIAAENYEQIKEDIIALKNRCHTNILPIILIINSTQVPRSELAKQDIFVFPTEDSVWKETYWTYLPLIKNSSEKNLEKYEEKKCEYIANLTKNTKSARNRANDNDPSIEPCIEPWKKDIQDKVGNPAECSGAMFNSSQHDENQETDSLENKSYLSNWCKLI